MNSRAGWLCITCCALLGGALGLLRETPEQPKDLGSRASVGGPRPNFGQVSPFSAARGSVEADAAKAFTGAALYPSRLHRHFAAFETVTALKSEDFKALLTKLKAGREQEGDATILVEAWAEIDPEAAAKFITSAPDSNLRTSVAKVWARKDWAAAVAWTRTMPEDERRTLLVAVLEGNLEAGRPDPMAILATVHEAPGRDETIPATESSFGFFSGQTTLMKFLETWAQRDPAAAQAFARNLPAGQREHALITVLANAQAMDPSAALDLYKQINFTDENVRHQQAVHVAGALAEVDVQKALALAEQEPAGLKRSEVLVGIAKKLLEQSPDKALALIDSVPLADSTALQGFFRWLSEKDPVAALQQSAHRLDQLDPESAAGKTLQVLFERELAGYRQVSYAATVAPALAADSNPTRQRALVGFMQQWINVDPTAAAAWTESLPAGTAREYAVIGTAQVQVKQSARDAVEWMKGLPAGDYNAAVEGFASGAFTQDPDGALAWLRTIADPAERARRLVAAWQRWGNPGIDPFGQASKAAEKWRDTSPDLTPAERALLVRQKE